MEETIINYFKNIIKKIQPDLSDEDTKERALKLKEAFERDDILNNPFTPLLLLLYQHPNIIKDVDKVIIKSFKDKTGVEATVEDIKLYGDLESEIETYKQIKEFLERKDINKSDIPPILTLILSCKATFLIPIKGKINELLNKQKEIIKKYE